MEVKRSTSGKRKIKPYTKEHWSFWKFAQESWYYTEGMSRWKFLWKLWGTWKLFNDMQHNRY
jgi:hypothetical protein